MPVGFKLRTSRSIDPRSNPLSHGAPQLTTVTVDPFHYFACVRTLFRLNKIRFQMCCVIRCVHLSLKRMFYIAQYPVRWTARVICTSPLADLFIPIPTRLRWEAFSHPEMNAQRLFTLIFNAVYCQVLIYTAEELGHRGDKETGQVSKQEPRGLRVRHSTAELLRSFI